MPRGICVALGLLLACVWTAAAEEYKGAKIKKAAGATVVLQPDEKEKKTIDVYLTKDTRYFDKEDNELKSEKGVARVKAGKLVDVTTEKVKANQILGKDAKGEVEAITVVKYLK